MNTRPINARTHALIDYALVSSLLVLPSVLRLPREVKRLYCIEALVLLGYVALTDQPVAVKRLIPFTTHGKIDPFNVGQFALQTLWKPFRTHRRALVFNLIFTAVAGATVALTDWKSME